MASISRRRFITSTATAALGTALAAQPSPAQDLFEGLALRGTNPTLEPGSGSSGDQSRDLQRAVDQASITGEPVILGAGAYRVSNLSLPPATRLIGVPGSTSLVYSGAGPFITARTGRHIYLSGIEFDGADLPLPADVPALISISDTADFRMENCFAGNTSKIAIRLERSGGLVARCKVSNASGNAAIQSYDATGLRIENNHVHDCADGGIYVWRRDPGEDGTLISGNRVERIGARSGGTGQFGNGINIFRAHNTSVQNNWVADCAFSAIRVNAGDNTSITGNKCLRNGETGIYVEFGFSGAVVSNNLIDGATGGISITNFNDGGRLAVVSNNLIRNLKTTGPYDNEIIDFGWGISVEADTTVTGNVIEGAPLYGINAGWGVNLRNVLIANNIIRDAGTGISVSVVENTGPTIVSTNLIDGARNGAILGYRWKDIATGELVDGTVDIPNLTITGNRVT